MKAVDHAARKHALLSASGSPRWMGCTPSARFEDQFPEQGSSAAAEEGTLGHEITEILVKLKLKMITQAQYNIALSALKQSEHYSDDLQELADKCAEYVYESYLHQKTVKIGKVEIFIEQKFDLTTWIKDGFGTNDCGIYAIDILEIIDYKFGRNEVLAENNPQLKIYALGVLHAIGPERAALVQTIKLTIVQPRLESISSWEISKKDLLHWAESELMPKAEQADKGEGEFVAGDHCHFCRAKAVCPAKLSSVMELAKLDFSTPMETPEMDFLTDEELVEVFAATKMVTDYLSSVKDYLFDRVRKGESIEGVKIVNGRGSRKFINEEGLIDFLEMLGYDEDQTHTKSLKGITAMEKAIGKKEIDTTLGPFIVTLAGAPQLALDSDKRQARGIQSAKADFSEPLN